MNTTPKAIMPAAFIGHGSPTNALERNQYTNAWRAFGAAVPRPRAVLVISAHWYIQSTAVTAMARPRTIHDFFGFPKELFDVQYPAPGDLELAQEIAELVKPTKMGLDQDSWGLDHGTWSVLVHVFPKADVPVLQVSINSNSSIAEHFELGTNLAGLRERGVLILGSGNIVHNLGAIDRDMPETGFDWAHRFDDAARAILLERPSDIGELEAHPDFAKAVPTPEHFLPVVYVAALAAASGRAPKVLVKGYTLGSLSMTSYGLDG